MRRISSREIGEWMAYERAFGPLNSLYADDMLATLVEQIQVLQQMWTAEEDRGPIVKMRRPHEVLSTTPPADDESDEVMDLAEFMGEFR